MTPKSRASGLSLETTKVVDGSRTKPSRILNLLDASSPTRSKTKMSHPNDNTDQVKRIPVMFCRANENLHFLELFYEHLNTHFYITLHNYHKLKHVIPKCKVIKN